MVESPGSPNERGFSGSSHDEWVELCALAASGHLSEVEAARLSGHLSICSECRRALEEFESVAAEVIPELGKGPRGESRLDPAFSEEKAEAAFLRRLKVERKKAGGAAKRHGEHPERDSFRWTDRYELWLPLAASVLLCASLGILSYRTGRSRGIEWARAEQGSPAVQIALTDRRGAVQAKAVPNEQELATPSVQLAELRREIAQKSGELIRLKAQKAEPDDRSRSREEDQHRLANEKGELDEERERLLQEVATGETALREAEERLKKLERERTEWIAHSATAENRIGELSNQLEARERQTAEQQELLAKDQDIRELIGARDLYITEIYDVEHNGEKRKADGRVFYTRGKSLVFYAYALQENPGVADASTFAAWGQRGGDWHQATKLGMFYQDNTTKKRWVVKSNDRKVLEQLDAVFITIEPNGRSEHPTSKPMLFAYLKVPPNHP